MTSYVLDVESVASWLQLPDQDATGNAILSEIVESVRAYVGRIPDKMAADANGILQPADASASLGCKMLAARLYRRRNTPNGVEAFTDGGAMYVARFDPDIGRMLGLYQPKVG